MRLGLMVLVAWMAASSVPAAPGSRRLSRRVDAWLEARASHDKAAARALLAPGARIWIGSSEGAGAPVSLDSPAWAWDDELNGSTTHGALAVEGDSVTGVFSDFSDFHRLLDIPSWKAQVTFTFDEKARITAIVHAPLSPPANPDMDLVLAPVIDWLRANRPDDLRELLPHGDIERNRDSARRFRSLLIEWRAATGRPQVSLSRREERIKPEFPHGMMDPPEIR